MSFDYARVEVKVQTSFLFAAVPKVYSFYLAKAD